MSDKITRREFLKMSAFGAASAGALKFLGPASGLAAPRWRSDMAAHWIESQDGFIPTTCGECPSACGLLVGLGADGALSLTGNPAHPRNRGNTCARAADGLVRLVNPARVGGPMLKAPHGAGFVSTDWGTGIEVVRGALANVKPEEIAFLLGLFPDHLYDLVEVLSDSLGGAQALRYDVQSEYHGQVTLMDAAQKFFGASKVPTFDIGRAQVIFSFGANFAEPWLSSGVFRPEGLARHARLVQFEPRESETAALAAEWVPIKPGSEPLLAQALVQLAAEIASIPISGALASLDLQEVSQQSGVPIVELQRLARLYIEAGKKVALPGGAVLSSKNGLAAAQSILALNALADNLGRDGGVFLMPDLPLHLGMPARPNTIAEVAALIDSMKSGKIKAIFLHGVDPAADLPQAYGFAEALDNVALVVSFSPYWNQTAAQAGCLLPDHIPLESWGYQKVVAGADRMTISGLQPAAAPLYNTRATADVLLEAALGLGGGVTSTLNFRDEIDFIQKSLAVLIDQGGVYESSHLDAFWELWQGHGGWWKCNPGLFPPVCITPLDELSMPERTGLDGELAEDECLLIPIWPENQEDDEGENPQAPWGAGVSQETTLVEIHPETARELGVQDGDRVFLSSLAAEIEAQVLENPGVKTGLVAVPVGLGGALLGHHAGYPRAKPLDLIGKDQNESGNLALMGARVKVTPNSSQVS